MIIWVMVALIDSIWDIALAMVQRYVINLLSRDRTFEKFSVTRYSHDWLCLTQLAHVGFSPEHRYRQWSTTILYLAL